MLEKSEFEELLLKKSKEEIVDKMLNIIDGCLADKLETSDICYRERSYSKDGSARCFSFDEIKQTNKINLTVKFEFENKLDLKPILCKVEENCKKKGYKVSYNKYEEGSGVYCFIYLE